jgi:hypothetical protein
VSQQPCPHCPALARTIQQQRAEIAVLRRIIAEAQAECVRLSMEADTITAGHVSRGRWAHADGQGKAACAILDRLS